MDYMQRRYKLTFAEYNAILKVQTGLMKDIDNLKRETMKLSMDNAEAAFNNAKLLSGINALIPALEAAAKNDECHKCCPCSRCAR